MIAIVDSGGANIASILFAIKRLGKKAVLTQDKKIISSAHHIILPGVGNAKYAMTKLENLDLITTLRSLTQPLLGICLGMQLLYDYSAEGNCNCLGIIPGQITKIPLHKDWVVPHMGWNNLVINDYSPLLLDLDKNSFVYFVHSYSAPINTFCQATSTIGNKTGETYTVAAVVQKNNFFGTQFHPERSGVIGQEILNNFLRL